MASHHATNLKQERKVMSMFDIIKQQMASTVPFATHSGVRLEEISDGAAKAVMDQTTTSINHIGSQHAGALFTLGEAASGGAMAGTFSESILSVRPIASDARIRYIKIAKGTISAVATIAAEPSRLRETMATEGKVVFDVNVTLSDEQGNTVADMVVSWNVRKA
jgi:uncharacterized protein (TIGR00369 family)